ncbi:MAG: glycosyltransferase family 4 protein [Elusimicrobia bacterium]|nr:glycosyltransferase family 4 protein [Elusimicrobiota bacterium]
MPPRSVVMVSAGFHPYVGGSEKQALELSVALKDAGWRVVAATRRLTGLPARETVRGVEVARLWAPWRGRANSLAFMASLFVFLLRKASTYDAIHVHLAGSPALPASLAGRILGKPVIVKLGGGRGIGELGASAGTFLGRLKIRLLRWLGPKFVVVTPDLREEVAAYGLTGGHVSVLPNGVDTRTYRPAAAAERAALRREWGWPEGLGFLYVGRLSPEKRLGMFLEALADSARVAKPPFFVSFVGEGPEERSLKELAAKLGLKAFFHWPLTDVWKAYQAADVFVLPSVSEGLSNSLLEAMACGLAALASRVGGTVDAVVDGKTGILFDDLTGLGKGIERLLGEPGLAAAMGKAGRERSLGFSITETARRYEVLYLAETQGEHRRKAA